MTTGVHLPIMFAIVILAACIPTIIALVGVGDYFGVIVIIFGALSLGLVVIPWIGWQILNLFNLIFDILEKGKGKSK